MATKINREALRQRIKTLAGLSDDERAALLELVNSKKYGLVWENHPEEVEERLRTHLPVLDEVPERYIPGSSPSSPNHILIEGDNLEALTALTYTHEGRIDVIYIDPPYNTGNKDFSYNDHYVDADDDYRHSKWLSFMSKRLRIARNLLSDRGVIFISIDDIEQSNLKLLCDEIFGNQNFIGNVCRQAIKGGSRALNLKTVHDFVLVYAKYNEKMQLFTGEEKDAIDLELIDEKGPYTKGRELNKWGAGSKREDSPSMWFPIKGPNGEEVFPIRNDGSEGRWRWGKKKLLKAVEEGDVIFERRDNGTFIAYEKVRALKSTTKQYNTWFSDNYINAKGAEPLKGIFNTLMSIFSYAKPIELIHDLVFMSNHPDGTILDFFAGSGTTMHAVMQLNKEDGGHRQCILVTNNENNICEEVTYERNRRVIQGYTTPKGVEVEGLRDNSLRYYRTRLLPRQRTNRNMRDLMAAATDLLCIKEDIFEELRIQNLEIRNIRKHVRLFGKGDRLMMVIYSEEAIPRIVEWLKTTPPLPSSEGWPKAGVCSNEGWPKAGVCPNPIKVYTFSYTNYAYDDDFAEVEDRVQLCALPAAIYEAYRRVLPQEDRYYDNEIIDGSDINERKEDNQ